MEWKKVKLGEVANIQTGPFGSQLHNEDYVIKGTPIVTVEHLGARLFSTQNLPCVSDTDKERLKKYSLIEGDIVFSRVGSVDRCSYVTSHEDGWLFSGRCLRVRTNEDIYPMFLYYYLQKEDIKQSIRNIAVGATMPSINTKLLSEIDVSHPSLETQRRIAAILSSLDDKIENNNRINRNLEAQAQALFKSWFVDFEPWGGKMPEDWREGVYKDIIEKTISGDWGKERPEGNYDHSVACIRGCDFEDIKNGIRGKTPQRYILEKNYQNKGLKNRDIVVEISGGTATVSTGRVCLITEKLLQKYDYDIVCTNFCRTIRPLADYYTYLYYSWKYKYDQRIMFGYENGTSGIKNFAVKDFIEKEPLIIPSCDIVKSFNKVISVLHDKIQENGTESVRLAALRDTLLPKLMKGEIEL